jgi:hypothetical protein
VAKGNDGNYLQHSVEVAAAVHLAAKSPQALLHIALAHGMAPFETCGQLPNGQARSLLHRALQAAGNRATEGELSIVTAYRATSASLENYPNTGELLRRMIGEDRLSGGITEIDTQKYRKLQQAWSGSGVTVVNSSWREEIRPDGVLMCPASLDRPWLLTADPMTYREEGYADDDNLYPEDLPRLVEALKSFTASRKPGVAALFVYSVKPGVRPKLWAFADEIANRTGTKVTPCWVTHQGGNRNLAALLCWAFVLPQSWLPDGVNAGR